MRRARRRLWRREAAWVLIPPIVGFFGAMVVLWLTR